jgi:hypothetical protein
MGGRELLTINSTSIGNEAKLIKLIHEVLECVIDDGEKLGFDESFDDPKAVPIVDFSEATTCRAFVINSNRTRGP